MKTYKITVEGKTYEVEVEQIGKESPVQIIESAPVKAAPIQPPAPQKTAPAPKTSGPQGKSKITCPMPGTILTINKKAGESVKKGDVVMILEAMKMENEIIAPEDATITSIDINEGASVNTGDTLATFE